jgi:hypothetical protein
MTLRYSTGTRNGLAAGLGFTGMFNYGYAKVYTGTQPATADAADTGGTLLGTITKASAALTKETRASATLTVTGGSGTLTALTAGTLPLVPDPSAVVWTTSTTVTAGLIADAINRNGMAEATSAGAVVTVKPRPGTGAAWNGLALAATGITCTGSNFASGVAPVNGLVWLPPASGVVTKNTDVWSMTGVAVGTAGWFRFFGSDTADTGAIISAAPFYPRFDGSCGVGSGDFQMSSLSVTIGSPHTVDAAAITFAAS